MKKLPRAKSHRVSLRQKHRLVKRAKEAAKKMKREAKRMKAQGFKKPTQKGLGIPNSCPFKKEIIEDHLKQQEQESRIRKEKSKFARKVELQQEYQDLIENAESTGFSQDDLINKQIEKLPLNPTQKKFYKELLGVLEESNFFVQVLDARDPQATRCLEMETKISQSGRKLLLVLNKADLVPEEVATAWTQKLNQEWPCFVAKLESSKSPVEDILNHIKQELPDGGRVGVIGYPNTGKSSFVNALLKTKEATVTTQPGCTKFSEEFNLTENLIVVDSPGVVFAGTLETKDEPTMILKTMIKIDELSDPYTPVHGILTKIEKQKLLIHYSIPDFQDISEFLASVARKKGKVVKGGMPDYDVAAKIVLHDWATHKIPFYTNP